MGNEAGDAKKRLYVSDVVRMDTIERGVLNLVYAPCGTGKTYFVENMLRDYRENPKEEMLYLVPTRALKRAFEFRGTPCKTIYYRGIPVPVWAQEGVAAMTYAAFGKMICDAKETGVYKKGMFWNNRSLICLDELSQAVHQSQYSSEGVNYTKIALKELESRIENESNVVITVSATPKALLDRYLWFSSKWRIHVVGMDAKLKGYETKNTEGYHELESLLNSVDQSERGLAYARQIETMKKGVALLKGRGISAECIFSDSNREHKMTQKQREIVKMLETEEKIPDDIQVLFINSAYETGLNIRPEKSPLDYIIVHDSNKDAQTQVRGRYRGDLDKLYVKQKVEDVERSIPRDVIAPYLGIRLGKAEKDEIREALNFRDDKRRLRGWSYVTKVLEEEGYTVDNGGKSGSVRYTVIEDPTADE